MVLNLNVLQPELENFGWKSISSPAPEISHRTKCPITSFHILSVTLWKYNCTVEGIPFPKPLTDPCHIEDRLAPTSSKARTRLVAIKPIDLNMKCQTTLFQNVRTLPLALFQYPWVRTGNCERVEGARAWNGMQGNYRFSNGKE